MTSDSARSRPLDTALRALLTLAAVRAFYLACAFLAAFGSVKRHHVESAFLIVGALAAVRLGVMRRDDSAARGASGWVRTPALAAAAIGAAFVMYWPALSTGLLSDDWVLTDWVLQQRFAGVGNWYVRPVPLILWHVILRVGGDAVALHALNIALHGVNATLTVVLLNRLGVNRGYALAAGLLFIVWPTQVEPVVWAACIFDVLMTTFVLAAVLTYVVSAAEFTIARVAFILTMTALALLTKETAVAIPVLIAIASCSRWVRIPPAAREWQMFAALVLLCSGYLCWRVLLPSQFPRTGFELSRYVLKEQISRSVGGLSVPLTSDTLINNEWIGMIFAGVITAPALWAIIAAPRRTASHELLAAGAIWPVVVTLPAMGYLLIGPHLEGSRYLYLAMAGWALFLVSAWAASGDLDRRWKWVGGAALTIVTILAVVQSRSLIADWRAAGAVRDRLLHEAHRRIAESSCTNPTFIGIPEMHGGAQLFRNGFQEALRRTMDRSIQQSSDSSCTLRWTGNAFVGEPR